MHSVPTTERIIDCYDDMRNMNLLFA